MSVKPTSRLLPNCPARGILRRMYTAKTAETQTLIGQRTQRWLQVTASVVFFLVLVGTRAYDIGADPTNYYEGGSQATTTDPGHLTWHARNAVLLHDWDLFDYEHMQVFKWSAISGVSYLLFKTAGVSRAVSNVSGVILNLLGILFFLLALRRHVSSKVLLITLFFISCSFVLTTYGRIAFTENGLLFFASLVYLVCSCWARYTLGQIAAGLLVGLAALTGKLFGLALAVPAVIYVWQSVDKHRWRGTLAVVGGAIAVPLLFELAVGGEDGIYDLVTAYLSRGHGSPLGLQSIGRLLIGIVTVGVGSRFFELTPFLSVLVFLFSFLAISGLWKSALAKPGIVFLFAWVWSSLLILTPFNYLPLRYFFPLIPPMAAMAAMVISTWSSPGQSANERPSPPSIWRLMWLCGLCWMFVFVVSVSIRNPITMEDYYPFVWYSPPVAVLIVVSWRLWIFPRRVLLPRWLGQAATSVVMLSVAGVFAYQTVVSSELVTYSIRDTNTDMGRILSADAVVSGPYGPALTTNTRLRSFPYYAGDVQSDVANAARMASLFGRYPITHLAFRKDVWQDLTDSLPKLAAAPLVARYWVRDVTIYVVRVTGVYGNEEASRYALSSYEKALLLRDEGDKDSAWAAMQAYVDDHPESLAGLVELYYMALKREPLEELEPLVQRLVALYPTDYSVHFIAALYYRKLGEETGSESLRARADNHLERAKFYNPREASYLDVVWREHFPKYGPSLRVV